MEFVETKTILSNAYNTEKWFGFDYNMNIYRGCSHGCIYCDSRSECYQVHDFDRVRAKKDCIKILGSELSRKRKKGVVATGAMSDPYNPCEKKYELTRKALELIRDHRFGLMITTKSSLIERDIEIIKQISEKRPVLVSMTITTADDNSCKKIEQNVSDTSERFRVLKIFSQAGIFTGILLTPILPFINDNPENISKIIDMAIESGVNFIYPSFGVTLRQNQRDYFYKKLDELYPGIKLKYEKTFGNSYFCCSLRSKELYALFSEKCKKYGILYKMPDIISSYKKEKYIPDQLSLF